MFIKSRKNCLLVRFVVSIAICCFTAAMPSSYISTANARTVLNLPVPGIMIAKSPSFTPASVKGINIHPDNPLKFDFIIDRGDSDLQGEDFRKESEKLIRYFLASLTIAEEKMWVNLSPYERDRIIPEKFGQTEMGRDLLAQDYMLKQLSASLMNPEEEVGRNFWKRIHAEAYERYGFTDIPTNTFNKIWIVPEEAVIYEHQKGAMIVKSYLKVMLEKDYLALEANKNSTEHGLGNMKREDLDITSGSAEEIIREILIPEIEWEVNHGKTFAQLRQIYHSMLLASWYKKTLKEGLLGQVYVDQGKVKGIEVEDKNINQKIYDQYVAAFEKGVFNFIKEDYDPHAQQVIPRKYFSGGVKLRFAMKSPEQRRTVLASASQAINSALVTWGPQSVGNQAMLSSTISNLSRITAGRKKSLEDIAKEHYQRIDELREYNFHLRNYGDSEHLPSNAYVNYDPTVIDERVSDEIRNFLKDLLRDKLAAAGYTLLDVTKFGKDHRGVIEVSLRDRDGNILTGIIDASIRGVLTNRDISLQNERLVKAGGGDSLVDLGFAPVKKVITLQAYNYEDPAEKRLSDLTPNEYRDAYTFPAELRSGGSGSLTMLILTPAKGTPVREWLEWDISPSWAGKLRAALSIVKMVAVSARADIALYSESSNDIFNNFSVYEGQYYEEKISRADYLERARDEASDRNLNWVTNARIAVKLIRDSLPDDFENYRNQVDAIDLILSKASRDKVSQREAVLKVEGRMDALLSQLIRDTVNELDPFDDPGAPYHKMVSLQRDDQPDANVVLEKLDSRFLDRNHRDVKAAVHIEMEAWRRYINVRLDYEEVLARVLGDRNAGQLPTTITVAREPFGGQVIGQISQVRMDRDQLPDTYLELPKRQSPDGEVLVDFTAVGDPDLPEATKGIMKPLAMSSVEYANSLGIKEVILYSRADVLVKHILMNSRFKAKEFLTADGKRVDMQLVVDAFREKYPNPTFTDYKAFFAVSRADVEKNMAKIKGTAEKSKLPRRLQAYIKENGLSKGQVEELIYRYFGMEGFNSREQYLEYHVNVWGDAYLDATHNKFGSEFMHILTDSRPDDIRGMGSNVILFYPVEKVMARLAKEEEERVTRIAATVSRIETPDGWDTFWKIAAALRIPERTLTDMNSAEMYRLVKLGGERIPPGTEINVPRDAWEGYVADKPNRAMLVKTKPTHGGIDFNPAIANMDIQQEGEGLIIPAIDPASFQNMNVEGFVPVIFSITPISNLPLLIGLKIDPDQDENSEEMTYDDIRHPIDIKKRYIVDESEELSLLN